MELLFYISIGRNSGRIPGVTTNGPTGIAFEKFQRRVLCTRFPKPLPDNDLRRRFQNSTLETQKFQIMQLKGHTVESAALASSIPAQIIQAAIDYQTPDKLVRLIESMIPPPAPPTRQDIIRKARGERTVEQQAALCDVTIKRYVAVEDGLCQPLSPRIFARGLGLTPEAVCAPMRNALYHARAARGVSQQTMANAIGISQSQLSKIETGMCTFPDAEKVQAYLDGKEIPQKPIDTYAYLRHKHNLTVADIMSLTGLSKDQVTYGCPELDSFFERIS